MTQALQDLGDHIAASLPGAVKGVSVTLGELSVTVEAGAIQSVLLFLKDDINCLFKQLMDITAVDYPERAERFEIVYNLLSLRHNQRVRVTFPIDSITPVPTVTAIFSSAQWYEREIWDMFGVTFAGNADLRRLLTDYGFEGHPLRKEFPLTGFVELRYDDEQKRVVYDAVKLTQDFRSFDFLSPWEGMLPGDEKAGENG